MKLSVVAHDDAQYVHIRAATDLDVRKAQVAIGEKVRELMAVRTAGRQFHG